MMPGVAALLVYLVFNYSLDIITQSWIKNAIKAAEK